MSLKPSPFTPDQFSSDDSRTFFIKKRPLDLTEDLVAGRIDSRPKLSPDPLRLDRLPPRPRRKQRRSRRCEKSSPSSTPPPPRPLPLADPWNNRFPWTVPTASPHA